MSTIRKVSFLNDYYYHTFNRGVDRRPIFQSKREYDRFMTTIRFYRYAQNKLKLARFLTLPYSEQIVFLDQQRQQKLHVEIVAYCLMPNHFHFLLKQKIDNGIATFISNLSNSYTKYFNTKHERIGPLLQGIFKAVFVETEEQLIHLSRYVHLNPVASAVIRVSDLNSYAYSSFQEYLGFDTSILCTKDIVLSNFATIEKYKEFTYDQIGYSRELENIKHLCIDAK